MRETKMETETTWKPEVKKMSPEQLEKWTALRKKCQVFPSRKPYSRKIKHKNRGKEENEI